MSLFDLLQQGDINHLHGEVDRLRRAADGCSGDARRLAELAAENGELRLRVGLLVRLLIAKGVFRADEFANLLAQPRPPQ